MVQSEDKAKKATKLTTWSEAEGSKRIERNHPPNLSISLSGGKESNHDCLSNGE